MAIRIKTFFVAIFFLILSYLILYYPILLTLQARYHEQYISQVKLNLIEKLVPIITSLLMVTLSILYRVYMQKLAEKRNPKN